MAGPFLGGFRITGGLWISTAAVMVQFESTYDDLFDYQLYAGRSLIGVTDNPADRQVVGQLLPSDWPQHLTLLAVEPGERLTEYGSLLPRRPYNKARLPFSVSGWPDDAKYLDLVAGTAPGGAVDADNRLERLLFAGDRDYVLYSPPMPGSGTWNFQVLGRDDKRPEGNAGEGVALQADLLAHPPDVPIDADGLRFTVTIENQVATVAFTYAE